MSPVKPHCLLFLLHFSPLCMKEKEMMVESNKQANKQMDKQAKAPSLNFVEGEKM